MIISGRLEELKGPGGLEAKFSKVANESISAASEKVQVDEMRSVEKLGVDLLERKIQELDDSQPIVMTMELGNIDYYSRQAVFQYIETLSQFRNFKFVVFVERTNQFVAYMPIWAIKKLLLRRSFLGDEFIDVINHGFKQELFSYPGVVRETIHMQSTNADALRKMTRLNLGALLVIDESEVLRGIVEREQILTRMMLSLTTLDQNS